MLNRYVNSRILAIDGAPAMIELAKSRLGDMADRVEFIVGDFRSLAGMIKGRQGQLAFSSCALHHLSRDDKLNLVKQVLHFLEPGGWFLNADLIVAPAPAIESRIQDIRVEGILRRCGGRDPRFADFSSTRTFLDDLEARDHDRPPTLA